MNLNIKFTDSPVTAAEFIAQRILSKLNEGKKVLWFATGGSSIKVCILVSEILRNHPHKNLTVALTDERYGVVGHKDSNWQQLQDGGFGLPEAKLLPILNGKDVLVTTVDFNDTEYKIGLFGVGKDGHTAGVLPESGAVESKDFVYSYIALPFERTTLTLNAIKKLDEAVVFMQGEEKWKVLEDLEKDIEFSKQPAQILKSIPLLTIFSDYKTK